MAKSPKPITGAVSIADTLPWSSTHFGDISEIEAHVGGKWETIAEVHSVGGLDAEDIADFIIQSANSFQKAK